MAVTVSKKLRKALKLNKGDTLEANVNEKNGILIYTKK
jgi:hypothetical protein